MPSISRTVLLVALLCTGRILHAENAVVGTGTPASCTEATLNAALALVVNDIQGGTLSFNCGPDPDIILLGSVKSLSGVVTIDGGGKMTLDGQDVTRIFNVNPRPNPEDITSVQLRNITLTRGNSGAEPFGGAMLVNAGTTVALDRVVIQNSLAPTSGGAIATFANVTLNITNSRFNSNLAANGGAIATRAAVTIADSTFANNNASGGEGGAVQSYEQNATILRSSFLGNGARLGGAIFKTEAVLEIRESTFSGNGSSQDGGAIYTLGNVLAGVIDSSVDANSAVRDGGGVFARGLLVLENSNFAGNTANAGGAVRMFGGEMQVKRVTMRDNIAQIEGGAISALTNSASLFGVNPDIQRLTTHNNTVTAGNGGDIALSSTNAIAGKIENATLMGASSSSGGSSIHLTNDVRLDSLRSLIWARAGTTCFTSAGANINSLGSNIGALGCSLNDPTDAISSAFAGFGLGELANYGGPVEVYLPLPGSAAIDRGGEDCSFDARNKPAPVDGDGNGTVLCDAGAAERQLIELPPALFRDGFETFQ